MKDKVKRVLTSEIPFNKQNEDGFAADYLQECLDVLCIPASDLSREDIGFVASYVRAGLKLSIGTPEYFSEAQCYEDQAAHHRSNLLHSFRTRVKQSMRPDL